MPHSDVDVASQHGPARILVVEDEALIRFAIAEALRDLGVSVVEAASGDEAWQFLLAEGAVDLVFTDHQMPGSLTGGQLAALIRQHYPRIGVVVTSAYRNDPGWSEPIVRKPYNLLKIAADLAERALARHQKEGGAR